MPSITGPYEPPFDPRDRPPTWLVPLAAVRREAQLLGVICKDLLPSVAGGRSTS